MWTAGRTLRGMAARSWASSITTAIGVSAGAAAAQLGLGYGLGIIAWIPKSEESSHDIWVNSLTWVAWLAATSTVVGALCADRLSPLNVPVSRGVETAGAKAVTIAWRVVVALAAAVGALITVPLVAVPARTPLPDNPVPYFTTAGYAVAGVIVGLIVAIAALSARPIATNVIATTAWLWTLAVVAVVDGVRAGSGFGTAQLGTWQFADASWTPEIVNLPPAALMLSIAFLFGFLAAFPAGRRGDNRIGVGISGAVGPALVAVSHLLATPNMTDWEPWSVFMIAPYAVLAGLVGSVIVALIGPKGAVRKERPVKAPREAKPPKPPKEKKERLSSAERKQRAEAELSDWTKALAATEASDEDFEDDVKDEPKKRDDESATVSASASSSGYERPAGTTYSSSDSQRAYAEDTGDTESSGGGVATTTSTASGRASVKEPLWPSRDEKPATATKPASTPKKKKR
jgi:hypothetical protein